MFAGACSEQGANVSDAEEQALSVERSVGFEETSSDLEFCQFEWPRIGIRSNTPDRSYRLLVRHQASGGVGGRYAVELEVLDPGGNPEGFPKTCARVAR
ncbi:MAG: hypothetical protein Ct9H300mP26_0400 [Acidimicrobiales bacterium]|nr:MAG: hypothetical protein Ct9H300mP26_0400 [Acidimicrobiales bacterium]